MQGCGAPGGKAGGRARNDPDISDAPGVGVMSGNAYLIAWWLFLSACLICLCIPLEGL